MLIKVIEKCFVLDDKVENYGIRTYVYETTANNFDTVEEFNNALYEEADGNYCNECGGDNNSQLIIVQDYTYYILTLEERDLE